MDWTHEQMLKAVSDIVANEKTRPDCMMVITLNNQGGRYDTHFWNCGMCISEMVALLERQKHELLKLMDDKIREDG
jgi:hypothetical protein